MPLSDTDIYPSISYQEFINTLLKKAFKKLATKNKEFFLEDINDKDMIFGDKIITEAIPKTVPTITTTTVTGFSDIFETDNPNIHAIQLRKLVSMGINQEQCFIDKEFFDGTLTKNPLELILKEYPLFLFTLIS